MTDAHNSENIDSKIPYKLATRLIESISKDGLVCRGDILSVEAEAGYTLFPTKLHNQVTSHKTSMGVFELLRYVKNNTQEYVDLTPRVLSKLSRTVNKLYNSDLLAIRNDLSNECKILESRYLPKSIQDTIMVDSNTVMDVPVSHFCRDGALSNNVDFSDSRIATYLGTLNSPVPFGLLARIAYNTDNDINRYDARSTNLNESIAFEGTARGYILAHVFILETLTKEALNAYREELMDNACGVLYPRIANCSDIFNTQIDEAVLKDNMILDFLN